MISENLKEIDASGIDLKNLIEKFYSEIRNN